MPATDFDAAYGSVAQVNGWMTEAQARTLWSAAAALPAAATVVEIGSFQGRSTIILASAAPADATVVAIDPHAGNDRGPQEFEGFEEAAQSDNEAFLHNLDAAGVRDRVTHLRRFSDDALVDIEGAIDLLYIDGAHRYRPALRDIRQWGERVRPGGTLLIHDSFSSVGVTLAILSSLLFDRRFTYVRRAGSMAVYERRPSAILPNALRQLAQLPWFVRNVVIKALILAKLQRATRLLGHTTGDWPY